MKTNNTFRHRSSEKTVQKRIHNTINRHHSVINFTVIDTTTLPRREVNIYTLRPDRNQLICRLNETLKVGLNLSFFLCQTFNLNSLLNT